MAQDFIGHVSLPSRTFYMNPAPQPQPMNRPWECPRCGTIHAGWVSSCRCKPPATPKRP